MHNQQAGLSQQLAAQRITERQEQAAQARLAHGLVGRVVGAGGGWLVGGGSWPAGQASPPSRRSVIHTKSVDRRHAMSKIARALILAVMVAVLPLAGMTAVAHAQANDQDTPSQQELAERWNSDYYQATHMSPTQHKAWLQANAAQRELSDRRAYSSHATQMSPAELKAWVQARDRAGTPTEKTHQVPAPVQPTEPSGQPLWLVVVALGVLAAALAIVAGLALLAARRANRQGSSRARDLATVTVTHSMGLPRPPAAPSPCRQPWHREAVRRSVTTSHLSSVGNGRPIGRFAEASPAQLWATLRGRPAPKPGPAPRDSPHPCRTYGAARPGKRWLARRSAVHL